MTPFLVRHLAGSSEGRFPVWMMRQAGRYLPAYRTLRAQYSFWERVTKPDLAVQISLMPLDYLPVDGVILFSDILTLPYGMGVPVDMVESKGPVLPSPLRSMEAYNCFNRFEGEEHVPYVGTALRQLRDRLPEEIALLGFAGAPWTLVSYLTEGKASRNFEVLKDWLFSDPAGLAEVLETVASATLKYLQFQVTSGAEVVQLFDTWLSEMPTYFFNQYYCKILNSIMEPMAAMKVPFIYYSRNAHHLAACFRDLKAQVMSVDSLTSLREADETFQGRFSLQGNLDPVFLLTATEEGIRLRTQAISLEARTLGKPSVLNLGHGILPNTPLSNAKAFVEEARRPWI